MIREADCTVRSIKCTCSVLHHHYIYEFTLAPDTKTCFHEDLSLETSEERSSCSMLAPSLGGPPKARQGWFSTYSTAPEEILPAKAMFHLNINMVVPDSNE